VRKRVWFLAPAVAAVLLSLAGPAAEAGTPLAQPTTKREVPITDPVPDGFSSWQEVMATQERLDRAADQITAAATGVRESGYAGLVVEPEARRVRLYWKGALPSSVRTVVDATGVSVTVASARYSERQLQAAQDRIGNAPAASLRNARSRVTAVSPMPDGSGLRVSVEGSTIDATSLTAVRDAGVEVTVDSAAPALGSRGNDSPPYFGGARTVNFSAAAGCTTGFGIFASGRTMMVSAGHCARNGDQVFDGGSDLMGTAIGVLPSKDLMLIDARSSGVVFNGGPGTGEFTNRVTGAGANRVGDFVCTSGALSGTRCNIKIVALNETVLVGPTVNGTINVTGLVRAEQQNFTNAGGQGDSGGPVFAVGADATTVSARGTITALDGFNQPVTCTGVINGRLCSWRIWYASINTALSLYGGQILTS